MNWFSKSGKFKSTMFVDTIADSELKKSAKRKSNLLSKEGFQDDETNIV